MRIYYFVHLTGRDTENSGIPRVVRMLGRGLLALGAAEVVPVRWSAEDSAVVYAEQDFIDNLAAYNGPRFAAAERPGQPIAAGNAADWLIIPEVPHLLNHDPRYPSVPIGNPLGYARHHGLRSAVVFHDLLPLTHPSLDGSDELDRLKFTVYAQAIVNADVILPVSQQTGALLQDWLANVGYRAAAVARLAPVPLPEEIAGYPRRVPDPASPAADGRGIEFLTFGTICTRKNQLAIFEAFNRLVARRPDLALTLHVVGHCEAPFVSRVGRQIARSAGRIVNHGYLTDDGLVELIAAVRATIFLSLAEGFGLPVAESLWLGTPCLCSDIAPISEIAEGGGCLTIDPTDIDAIGDAIERLATDEALHRRLLSELAERKFRTWKDYAAAVTAELTAEGGADRPPIVRRAPVIRGSEAAAPPPPRFDPPLPSAAPPTLAVAAPVPGEEDGEFTIAAADLTCHEAFVVDGENLLRQGDRIEFDADRSATIVEPVLFFGPYRTVEPGVYLFDFAGRLDGTMTLRFTHGQGQPIKEFSVDSFEPLVCLVLTSRYEEFEVVGERTKALRSMQLQSIRVRHIKTGRAA